MDSARNAITAGPRALSDSALVAQCHTADWDRSGMTLRCPSGGEPVARIAVRAEGWGALRCGRERASEAELDALIAQATVDCYSEDEELAGFAAMIGDNLAVPFETTVLGVTVTVRK